MKARTILFVLALAIVLFFTGNSWGAQPQELLRDKFVEYEGVCRFDSKGQLTFDDKKTKAVEECVVGASKDNNDLKTVLVLKEGQPQRIIEYSLKKRTQRILWANKTL